MNWTPAQEQTINTRGSNILVSAAAGSGKTTVMIERVKQLVLRDRVDIDRFLITTFTNAAASEMKEKMERAIRAELDRLQETGGSREEQNFLQKQLDLLPQASISTFHTFALGIMRDFFYLTDLQPGFSIGDETRLDIMRRESLDQVFERRFEEDGEAFRDFLRSYSADRNDNRLKERLLAVYQEMRSIPHYFDWARERTARMEGDHPLMELGIGRFLLSEIREALREAIRWFAAAAEILDREETGTIFLKARKDVQNLESLCEQVQAECSGDADPAALARAGELLAGFKATTMSVSKAEKPEYEKVKAEVTRLRDRGKKRIKKILDDYFDLPPEEHDRILRSIAPDTAYFVDLLRELEEVYLARKQEAGTVDFDDCMHVAIRILEDPQAAAEYRDRFEYIFIDEYQDSNLLQEEIISRIAREDNLFMVGDVKQSIYKFRLAEPEIFYERYRAYRSGADEHSMRIDLNSNFRSRKTIRQAVNRIFEGLMEGYDEDARLNGPEEEPSAGYPVSLHILTNRDDESEEETDRDEVLEELTEQQVIADIIRETIGQPITGRDGGVRPISYGDIAVLSRGGKLIPEIERYLNNEGIPAFGETAGGYYETVEIQVFLNLLKIISNLRQDVPLISAMSSVVFGFTPTELARIRMECREGSYSQAVRAYETGGSDPALRDKISAMLARVALWKEIGRTVPLEELLRCVLYDTGYYDYCSGLPAGDRRTANLRLLLEKAASYESSSHMGLYGFLAYVEAMKKNRQKVSEASLVAEGRDVVHVMTVHKSKGLEFPVVILAGAGRKITSSSEGRAPAMHKGFAIGLPEVHRDLHWERKTILQKAIAGRKTRENLEEEVRILYVALTRPMEKLAIVGSVKDPEKLPGFPARGSFLEMIYGTLRDMAREDPAAARLVMHAGGIPAGGSEVPDVPDMPEMPEEEKPEHGPIDPAQPPDPAEIGRRLSFVYPYEQDQSVRTKYSVTALNRMQDGSYTEETRAADLIPLDRIAEEKTGQKELSSAEIGTAMHTCMERIDFRRALEEGLPYIREAIGEFRARGILTEEEYQAVRPDHIDAFFRAETGARAAGALLLRREQEFLLQKEISGVPTVVQGIIDCWFEDEQGVVLIDYKNSWAPDEEAEAVILERYAGQVRLYREALEKAVGKPVSQAWLYLFKSRRFVNVPLEGGMEYES